MEVSAGQAQYRAMKTSLVGRPASMILGLVLVTVPGLSGTHAGDVRITIRVMDFVNLPGDVRSEVAANAKRVLGQAGVAAEFVECFHDGVKTDVPVCAAPLGPDVVLRILEPKQAMKDKQLGYAAMTAQGGACVTVFMDPAQRRARVSNLSDGVLLGHAVAHEIGHLLLGADSHSSSGIMRPRWRPCDEEWMVKSALLFDAGQAKRMRSALMERASQWDGRPY
jgi:hypothetical protein